MQRTPQLSIIVPVFKTEAYLRECIDSILAQTFADYELILVDDGSPDGCGAICDAYARDDGRVRVLHRPNGGLSAARNSGLDVATGKWVTFVDSDDFLAPDTYAANMKLLCADEEIDVVEFPVYVYYDSPRQHVWSPGQRLVRGSDEVWIDWVNTRRFLYAYAWNKIYRRSLFRDVRYPEGRHFEDVFVFPEILDRVRGVQLSDAGLYYYRFRADSITGLSSVRTLRDRMDAFWSLYQKVRSLNGCDGGGAVMYLMMVNILIELMRASGRKDEYNSLALRKLRGVSLSWHDLMQLQVPSKVKIKNLPLVCCGLSFHCQLYARKF